MKSFAGRVWTVASAAALLLGVVVLVLVRSRSQEGRTSHPRERAGGSVSSTDAPSAPDSADNPDRPTSRSPNRESTTGAHTPGGVDLDAWDVRFGEANASGPPFQFDVFLQALARNDPALTKEAIERIPPGAPPEVVPLLLAEWRRTSDPEVHYYIIECLARAKADRAVIGPFLIDALHEARIAGYNNEVEAVFDYLDARQPIERAFLLKAYAGEDGWPHGTGIQALVSACDDPQVMDIVREFALHEQDEDVRLSIAGRLESSSRGNYQQILDLLAVLAQSDPSLKVREEARRSIGTITRWLDMEEGQLPNKESVKDRLKRRSK